MITIFWNPLGFHIIDILPEGEKFNSQYFIDNILQKIYEMTSKVRKEHHRKITLHFDNARPHTSRKVQEYMALHKMKRAPHPPYSPDIAPCDFYLFGNIKEKLKPCKFKSPDELVSAISEILSEIDKDERISVFHDWEKRLQHVIDTKGDYY